MGNMTVRDAVYTIDGKDTAYWLRNGGDEAIVFVHGLGCSKESFLPAFEDRIFSDRYTLLAGDLLGFGASSKPENYPYRIEDQVENLASLINYFSFSRLHLVGHSMGGTIALQLAKQHPETTSFFCLEGNLVPADCTISRRVSAMSEDQFVKKFYPLSPLTFRCKGLESEPPASAIAYYRSAKSLKEFTERARPIEDYIRLAVNKAYIYGEENRKAEVLGYLQNLDVVEIGGCGHFMMMDKPRSTYGVIVERLQSWDTE